MKFVVFLLGVVLGALGLGVVLFATAPELMLTERKSPLGLEETVSGITKAAEAKGWVVQGVTKLDESVKKHGGPEVRPVRLVNLCEPHHAGKILAEDDNRLVSVFMPCTIAVYEKQDGTVWIAAMQPKNLGRLFGGTISEVMAGPVAADQESILDAVAPIVD